ESYLRNSGHSSGHERSTHSIVKSGSSTGPWRRRRLGGLCARRGRFRFMREEKRSARFPVPTTAPVIRESDPASWLPLSPRSGKRPSVLLLAISQTVFECLVGQSCLRVGTGISRSRQAQGWRAASPLLRVCDGLPKA